MSVKPIRLDIKFNIVPLTNTLEMITDNTLNPAPKGRKLPDASFPRSQCASGNLVKAVEIISHNLLQQKSLKGVYSVTLIPTVMGAHIVFETDERAALLISLKMALIINQAFPEHIPTDAIIGIQHQLKELESDPNSHLGIVQEIREINKFEKGFKTDFLRRVPLAEREALVKKIHALKRVSKEQLAALITLNLSHEVFKHPQWPILVMSAFFDGLMNEMQASKLLLYAQSLKESPAESPARIYQ